MAGDILPFYNPNTNETEHSNEVYYATETINNIKKFSAFVSSTYSFQNWEKYFTVIYSTTYQGIMEEFSKQSGPNKPSVNFSNINIIGLLPFSNAPCGIAQASYRYDFTNTTISEEERFDFFSKIMSEKKFSSIGFTGSDESSNSDYYDLMGENWTELTYEQRKNFFDCVVFMQKIDDPISFVESFRNNRDNVMKLLNFFINSINKNTCSQKMLTFLNIDFLEKATEVLSSDRCVDETILAMTRYRNFQGNENLLQENLTELHDKIIASPLSNVPTEVIFTKTQVEIFIQSLIEGHFANDGNYKFQIKNLSTNENTIHSEIVSDTTRFIVGDFNMFSFNNEIKFNTLESYIEFMKENLFSPISNQVVRNGEEKFYFKNNIFRAIPNEMSDDEIKTALRNEFGEITNIFIHSYINGDEKPTFIYFILSTGEKKFIVNSNSGIFGMEAKKSFSINGTCPADKKIKDIRPNFDIQERIIDSKKTQKKEILKNVSLEEKFSKSFNKISLNSINRNGFEYINSKNQKISIQSKVFGNGYEKIIFNKDGEKIATKSSDSAFFSFSKKYSKGGLNNIAFDILESFNSTNVQTEKDKYLGILTKKYFLNLEQVRALNDSNFTPRQLKAALIKQIEKNLNIVAEAIVISNHSHNAFTRLAKNYLVGVGYKKSENPQLLDLIKSKKYSTELINDFLESSKKTYETLENFSEKLLMLDEDNNIKTVKNTSFLKTYKTRNFENGTIISKGFADKYNNFEITDTLTLSKENDIRKKIFELDKEAFRIAKLRKTNSSIERLKVCNVQRVMAIYELKALFHDNVGVVVPVNPSESSQITYKNSNGQNVILTVSNITHDNYKAVKPLEKKVDIDTQISKNDYLNFQMKRMKNTQMLFTSRYNQILNETKKYEKDHAIPNHFNEWFKNEFSEVFNTTDDAVPDTKTVFEKVSNSINIIDKYIRGDQITWKEKRILISHKENYMKLYNSALAVLTIDSKINSAEINKSSNIVPLDLHSSISNRQRNFDIIRNYLSYLQDKIATGYSSNNTTEHIEAKKVILCEQVFDEEKKDSKRINFNEVNEQKLAQKVKGLLKIDYCFNKPEDKNLVNINVFLSKAAKLEETHISAKKAFNSSDFVSQKEKTPYVPILQIC